VDELPDPLVEQARQAISGAAAGLDPKVRVSVALEGSC